MTNDNSSYIESVILKKDKTCPELMLDPRIWNNVSCNTQYYRYLFHHTDIETVTKFYKEHSDNPIPFEQCLNEKQAYAVIDSTDYEVSDRDFPNLLYAEHFSIIDDYFVK
jgi:hypothetical protein